MKKIYLSLQVLVGLLLPPFCSLLIQPAHTHELETSENIGVTLHIEPNDVVKAGESYQAWFALTRLGARVVPLNQCDCKLSIFSQPRSPTSQPISQPSLKPLSKQGYKNIPSAIISLPKVGGYELELVGKPINGEDFKPFKFNFKVLVPK